MIIDANVIKGFFQEDVLGLPSGLTESPAVIFASLSNELRIFVDSIAIMENEWRNVVEREWFDGWYSSMLTSDKIQIIKPKINPYFAKKLYLLGFPKNRDIWYVRTAEAVSIMNNICILVSEDIHFYDPKKGSTSGKARLKVLCSGNAPVRKLLKRRISTLATPIIQFKDTQKKHIQRRE